MNNAKVLYRYEIYYKNYDGDTDLVLREYKVLEETDKTYVIDVNWRRKRVKKDAYNTYAFNNKEDALDHLIRRTRKRISWYEYWIEECNKALELAKELGKNNENKS